MTACATGKHLPEATLTQRKAGKEQHEYLIIKMNDVLVTSVVSGGGGEPASESVTFELREGSIRVQASEA